MKLFPGFKIKRYPGRKKKSTQGARDFILFGVASYYKAQGYPIREVINELADGWGVDRNNLRTRYYKLTKPASREEHVAVLRMNEAGAAWGKNIKKQNDSY